MIDQAVVEMGPLIGTAKACALVGKSRATLYRWRRPVQVKAPRTARTPANALSPSERRAVMDVLHRSDYVDLAVAQVWARELDEDRYHCSMSTMYRKGPRRGIYYPLYSIIDILSRYVPGHLVATVESGEIAERLIEQAVASQGIERDTLTLHADRGAPMTSGTVVELLANLGVTRSHSRPRCSNDNPFIEANYKTLKYCPQFPERFENLGHAQGFCAWFFNTYNHEHRHSALGWHTPASVHFGTAPEIRAARQATLDAAYASHPERFASEPFAPKLPTVRMVFRGHSRTPTEDEIDEMREGLARQD